MKIFARHKWPVVLHLYDGRQCPGCAAVVLGNSGQAIHQQYHDDVDAQLAELYGDDGEVQVPLDGYVIGSGPLPVSMRGGEDGLHVNAGDRARGAFRAAMGVDSVHGVPVYADSGPETAPGDADYAAELPPVEAQIDAGE